MKKIEKVLKWNFRHGRLYRDVHALGNTPLWSQNLLRPLKKYMHLPKTLTVAQIKTENWANIAKIIPQTPVAAQQTAEDGAVHAQPQINSRYKIAAIFISQLLIVLLK